MATIVRRGQFWRARIRRGGLDLNRTFDTESEARAWAQKEEASLDASGQPAPLEMSCAALFDRYAKEVSPGKKGARWEIVRLRAFQKAFTGPAAALDGAEVATWRDRRLKEVSPASVNRDLNLLGAVYTRAIKEWRCGITINPVGQIQRPKQPKGRNRRVSDEELATIVHELGWKRDTVPSDLREWVAWAACFALETAMRKSEILGMRWPDVYQWHVHLPDTKNGQARNVPLSSRARGLLEMLERGNGSVVPVHSGTFDAYWRAAVTDTGISDLHFHDLRHEATTRMAPLFRDALELSRVTGHTDLRSLSGYYHPDAADLARKLG